MKIACRSILFSCCVVVGLLADAQIELYQKHWFVKNADTLPYRLLLPENYDPNRSYPLVLFLHGAGERGNDNEAQLKHGGSLFLQDSIRKKYPAIVIIPQCPANSFWSNVDILLDTITKKRSFNFKTGGRPTIAMKLLQEMLVDLESKYKIDEHRRYIGGLSMGAMGTYELVRRKPKYFAGAIAICGGAHTKTAKHLTKTSWWIFHGKKDDVVPFHFSEDIANALKQEGAVVKFTAYPDANHNSWDNTFAVKDLFPWLFSNYQ